MKVVHVEESEEKDGDSDDEYDASTSCFMPRRRRPRSNIRVVESIGSWIVVALNT